MRLRITIDYDYDTDQPLADEVQAWREGAVGVPDILACGDEVVFEMWDDTKKVCEGGRVVERQVAREALRGSPPADSLSAALREGD